jgi:hypothetical protein
MEWKNRDDVYLQQVLKSMESLDQIFQEYTFQALTIIQDHDE